MQVKLFERLVFRFLLEDLLNSLNLSVFLVSEESKLELKNLEIQIESGMHGSSF